ncbi:MAG: hypothetical protein Q4F39_06825 [Bacteroidia bacterium]|nr:hypothetical protein [Bacteroidia bacterium]
MKHYYHCASKGLEDDFLFKSILAFIAGMNRIGICYLKSLKDHPVKIIAFCLMDNHVHFILYGTKEDCLKFMADYRALTEMWLIRHGEKGDAGKNWKYDAWPIKNNEDLKEKIIYVHRNPIAARINLIPSGYRWSSAPLIFNDNSFYQSLLRPINSLSQRKRRTLFNTKTEFPNDWTYLPDGMIWPGCYCLTKNVETMFKTAWNYQFELNQRVEETVNTEILAGKVSLPDGDVLKIASKVSGDLFGIDDIDFLTIEQRIKLCTELRKSTGANIGQLARLVHINILDLKQILR